jgi:hypothetical protein
MKIDERLTTISEITGLPMLKAHKESCGEDSCADSCEVFGEGQNPCKDCPVQEGITRLSAYEDAGLSSEEVLQLKAFTAGLEPTLNGLTANLNKINDIATGFMEAGPYEDPDTAALEAVKKIYDLSILPIEPDNRLQKAFALACRLLDDYSCPADVYQDVNVEDCPENCGEPDCEERAWRCWQKKLLEIVDAEPVCRVCGCTQDNACPGGCSWVEDDLCSCCAEKKGDGQNVETEI